MKHTKSPWFGVEYSGYYNIQSVDEYSLDNDLLDAARCHDAEANAKLAAAAPELLEALTELEQYWASGNFSRKPTLWNKMKAAIKKATE